MTQDLCASDPWPPIPYGDWQSTAWVLHLYLQIAGKYRLTRSPWNKPLSELQDRLDELLNIDHEIEYLRQLQSDLDNIRAEIDAQIEFERFHANLADEFLWHKPALGGARQEQRVFYRSDC